MIELPVIPEWQFKSACAGENPQTFYAKRMEKAKALCAVCPVIDQCLDFALTEEGNCGRRHRYGVFGGLSSTEREVEYQRRNRRAA